MLLPINAFLVLVSSPYLIRISLDSMFYFPLSSLITFTSLYFASVYYNLLYFTSLYFTSVRIACSVHLDCDICVWSTNIIKCSALSLGLIWCVCLSVRLSNYLYIYLSVWDDAKSFSLSVILMATSINLRMAILIYLSFFDSWRISISLNLVFISVFFFCSLIFLILSSIPLYNLFSNIWNIL